MAINVFRADPVFGCGFEDIELCGMSQSLVDEANWKRQQGNTPTMGTGPESAYQNAYFVYIETTSSIYRATAS